MPRIRTIKPEFWSSPSHRYADPWVRLFYQSMWNWADDTGRGTANPRELAAFAFPDDEDPTVPTVDDIPRLLLEVHKRYDVVFYKVDGRRYYEIPSWDRHQRNERKAASRHPGPEDGSPYDPGPGDGASYTEARKLRDASTEAPTGRGGRPQKGSQRGGEQQSFADRAEHAPEAVEEQEEDAPEQAMCPPPMQEHGSSVHDDGSSSLGTGEPGTGEPGTYCDAASLDLVLVDAVAGGVETSPRTPNQRAKALADIYCGLVPLSTFMAIRGVVKKAINTGLYSDDKIEAGLRKLAAEKRPLNATTLRIAIEGLPNTDDKVAAVLAFYRPEEDQHHRGNAS